MMDKITTDAQYNQVMASIEKFIEQATAKGGFIFLSGADKEELSCLSSLAEQYEDNVLKLMPLIGKA